MTAKHSHHSSDDNLESLAHDLLGIDLNAGDDSDEPLDVDGLGLDDLGFGPAPEVVVPPMPGQTTVAASQTSLEGSDDDDPLAWIVKAAKSPVAKPAPSQSFADDDWDDDFGGGLADDLDDLPSSKPAPSKAAREILEFDHEEDIDDVEIEEIEISAEVDDEAEECEEQPQPLDPVTRDKYWDALEGWDGWEDKPADSAAKERSGRSGRGSPRGSARGSDRRPDRKSNRSRGESRSEERPAEPKRESASRRESEKPEGRPGREPRRERADSESRRSSSPRKEEVKNVVPREKEEIVEAAPVERPRRSRSASEEKPTRGRRSSGRTERTESSTPVHETPTSSPQVREPADRSEKRRRPERAPAPPVAPSVAAIDEDDDFGLGILGEPAAPSAVRPVSKKRPPVYEDDFGSDLDDDFEDQPEVQADPQVIEDPDDFGAGIVDAPVEKSEQRRRRPPRRRRATSAEAQQGSYESSPSEPAQRPRHREEPATPAVPDEKRYEDVPTWEFAISLLVKKQGRSGSSGRRSNNGGGRSDSRRRGNGSSRGGRSHSDSGPGHD